MALIAVFILAGLFASCESVNVALGQATTLSANAWTNVTYQYLAIINYQVSIWSNIAASATFDVYVPTDATLWTNLTASGSQALNIGAGLSGAWSSPGYQLTVTNNAQITAVVVFPPLDVSVYALLTTGVDAGCLQYTASTGALVRVSTVNYVPATWTMSVTLPSAGIYLFTAITEVYTASATVGATATVTAPAWCGQTYQWSVKAASDLMLVFNSSSSTTVTVQPVAQTTYSTEGLHPLNIWFNINLGTTVSHNSQIKYKYTSAQLAAVNVTDASRLRLAWYDTTQSKWTFPSGGASVDVNAQVVFQSTSSFSQWGVYYQGTNSATSLQTQVFFLAALMTLVLGFIM